MISIHILWIITSCSEFFIWSGSFFSSLASSFCATIPKEVKLIPTQARSTKKSFQHPMTHTGANSINCVNANDTYRCLKLEERRKSKIYKIRVCSTKFSTKLLQEILQEDIPVSLNSFCCFKCNEKYSKVRFDMNFLEYAYCNRKVIRTFYVAQNNKKIKLQRLYFVGLKIKDLRVCKLKKIFLYIFKYFSYIVSYIVTKIFLNQL